MVDIWKVEYKKVKDLIPNAKNPRTISKSEFNRLKSKIKELGFHNPPKLDNEGQILGGNQRYNALIDMGLADLEIPVMVPTRKLTDKEKDKLIVDDNISDGQWDFDKLANAFDLESIQGRGLEIPDIDDADLADKKYDSNNAQYPIVPKVSEKYDGVLVFCENEIDFINLCEILNLKKAVSYKSETKVGMTRVIGYKDFIKCLKK